MCQNVFRLRDEVFETATFSPLFQNEEEKRVC